jgi:hypothetical protein
MRYQQEETEGTEHCSSFTTWFKYLDSQEFSRN